MKNTILALLLLSSSLVARTGIESETIFTGSGDSPGQAMDNARVNMGFSKMETSFSTSDTHQVSTNCYVTIIKAKYVSDIHHY